MVHYEEQFVPVYSTNVTGILLYKQILELEHRYLTRVLNQKNIPSVFQGTTEINNETLGQVNTALYVNTRQMPQDHEVCVSIRVSMRNKSDVPSYSSFT